MSDLDRFFPGEPFRGPTCVDAYTVTDEDDAYEEWEADNCPDHEACDIDSPCWCCGGYTAKYDPGHYAGPDILAPWHSGAMEDCKDQTCVAITAVARNCG